MFARPLDPAERGGRIGLQKTREGRAVPGAGVVPGRPHEELANPLTWVGIYQGARVGAAFEDLAERVELVALARILEERACLREPQQPPPDEVIADHVEEDPANARRRRG